MRSIDLPVVRALGQFGPMPKFPHPLRLFLDDARNPPLYEKGWVVVRTVQDGQWFMREYGRHVTTVSLDNDLGPDPQGYVLLDWILRMKDKYQDSIFPNLTTFIIHTGNMPKWRLMIRMLRGKGFKVKRIVPTDRIYPRLSSDPRTVKAWTA